MTGKTRRGMLAALIGAGLPLAVLSTAAAAPPPAPRAQTLATAADAPAPTTAPPILQARATVPGTRTPATTPGAQTAAGAETPATAPDALPAPARHRPALFHIAATDMEYGQPNLYGDRRGTTTITFTNKSRRTVQYPMLTFPNNGRDEAEHALWQGCPVGLGRPDRWVCIAEPLGPGQRRSLTFPWVTRERGPAGPAEVRIEAASDLEGTPVPGTAASTTWYVSFAPLTGTFDITATDLTYGPLDADGIRRGSTTVTVTNLTGSVIDYPLVTFPASSGAADHTLWTGCPVVIRRPDETVCVAEPLAAGEQRAIAFPFVTELPGMEFDATVRVDAGADRDGTVIDGTAAGTSYHVNYAS
jgi:hypothetical protein